MKTSFLVVGMLALGACVDSGCPKGSVEVSGTCMTVSSVEDGDGGVRDGGRELSDGRVVDERKPDADSASHDDDKDAESTSDASDSMMPTCATHACGRNAHCEQGDDGPRCACDEGYEGDGESCEVDPCSAAADPCDATSTDCSAVEGEAVCECREGFARCDDDAHACTTDLLSDARNCGECGRACAGDLECVEGECEQAATALALGQRNTCALAADGEVLCWGDDTFDQLQRADSSARSYEAAPAVVGKARLLSSAARASCALTLEDELVCWGDNAVNWIADGPLQGLFTVASDVGDVEQISVGVGSACLVVGGELQCWGIAQTYSASSADIDAFEDDRFITLPNDVVQVSLGYSACAVTNDARVSCWGQGVATPAVVESAAGPLEDVRGVSVSPGRVTACAVLGDGRAMCWGLNRLGMLGNVAVPLDERRDEAVAVTDEAGSALTGIVQVAVGSEHACALRDDGSVLCWGRLGQLGNGGTGSEAQRFATDVLDLDDAIDLVAGTAHTCVRKRSGQVQCWGDNGYGQLGVAPTGGPGVATSSVPVDVIGLP